MLEDVSSIVSSAFSTPARAREGEGRQRQEGLKKRDGEQRKAQLSCKWPWSCPGSKALPGCLNRCCTCRWSSEMSSVLQCGHRWDWSPQPPNERGDCAFGWPQAWLFLGPCWGMCLSIQCYHCLIFSARAREEKWHSWLVIMIKDDF